MLREIEYLKKETQRCAQDGAEASELQEESGQLEEQVTVNLPPPVVLTALWAPGWHPVLPGGAWSELRL